ncbi:hypothetical protein [Pseudoxanthomonas mexicana]
MTLPALKNTALLIALSVLSINASANDGLKGLMRDVVKDATQSSGGKNSGAPNTPTNLGNEVTGLKYYADPQFSPRWRVGAYTPEQINGYHHLRIGVNQPSKWRPNDADTRTDINCEMEFLGAAVSGLPYDFETLITECSKVGDAIPSPQYIEDRIAYYRGKNKFYFRAGSDAMDVRWNSHLQETVVTITSPLIEEPDFGKNRKEVSRFILEGRGFSNEFWDPRSNYSEATGNTKPERMHVTRYQTFLSNDRSEFPKGNLYNTVFFTIEGPARYKETIVGGVKVYTIPVSIDRIEIADRDTALVVNKKN